MKSTINQEHTTICLMEKCCTINAKYIQYLHEYSKMYPISRSYNNFLNIFSTSHTTFSKTVKCILIYNCLMSSENIEIRNMLLYTHE